MKLKAISMVLVAVAFVSFAGCGKKADANKPLDQIQKEVETMSANDLQAYAQSYVKEINNQKKELGKVGEQVKSLSPKELFSDKAREIKDQLGKIEANVSNLTQRYQVYADKFREKGGDLNKIQIS